ncbi:BnaC08g08590D [Brassica napus]|uniref:BnaC08g08590D protein n=1 Tax=Brassica napus TaxID=3708 RepID=A0A078G179_BRANA|nr:BnaC08g08590D [Brassica napus]
MINLTYKKVKSSSHSITLINSVSSIEQDDEIRFLGLW